MTFRTRLTLALLAIVTLPIAILGYGVRREMAARLDDEAQRRVDAVRSSMSSGLSAAIAADRARLQSLASGLAADNRFRIDLSSANRAERRWLLDWASGSMTLAGFAVLQLQDSTGRVLSSGQFRNDFDRVDPTISRVIAASPLGAAVINARTPDGPVRALATIASFTARGERFTLVGGATFDSARVARLSTDGTVAALAAVRDGPLADGAVTTVSIPYVDEATTDSAVTVGRARLVLVPDTAPTRALKAGVVRWLFVTLGGTLLVAIVVATILGRLISAPIAELAARTARLDLDELHVKFATGRDDELGALERTLDALAGRLRTSVARLREAERAAATGDLARQVNHDIKNGLAPIRNVLRHLAQTAEHEPAALAAIYAERRGTLESSVEYLDQLARTYARLSPALGGGVTDPRPVVLDVARGVSAATVDVRLADELPTVRTDAVVLHRILDNLVSNAVDALDGKPGTITVAAEAVGDGSARRVRFTVVDTGRGMTEGELDRAFNDFYTTKAAGTGLGLSVVRRLLTDVGGSVRAVTAPGEGSTFTVEIPTGGGEMSRILVVDDVPALAGQYAYDLTRIGAHEVVTAASGAAALKQLDAGAQDCIILDLEMPGMDGFEVLRALKHRGDDTPVIVYTGVGDFSRCIEAVRLGAAGFIDKAEPMERVAQEVEHAIERHRLRSEVFALQTRLGESTLLGHSAAIERLRGEIARVAAVPSAVLITGESGTGKELVARELHRLGANPTAPLIALNCAALPEHLVESELFGHERGAFTGATGTRKGAFETAGSGTLFLDEIGEMPLAMQPKLLRVLEERTITRVGGSAAVRVAARIVAATNRDLEEMVRAKEFREDLLYRLNVHVVRMPPLRDRRDDVPLLAERFLEAACREFGILPKRLAPEAREALAAYDWRRNNVRELRNAIERATVAAEGEMIRAADLAPAIRGTPESAPPDDGGSFHGQRAAAERRIVLAALEKHGWQITKTAESLSLADHASLLKIMRRLGIQRG